jgi:MFS family permease
MLPLVLSLVVASTISGAAISKIGYYTPFMLVGICIMCVASGLLTTLQVNTEQAKWVGYQFLFGFGLGMTFQAPNLAAQTVLPTKDVPIGTSLMFFSQLLGGAIFISVGQNVLNNQLLERLTAAIPDFDPETLKNTGATSLTHLPDDIKPLALVAYNESLRKVFQVGLIIVCLTILGGVFIEFRSVKEKQKKKAADLEQGEESKGNDAGAGAVTDHEATDVDEKNPSKSMDEDKTKSAEVKQAESATAPEKDAIAKGEKTS